MSELLSQESRQKGDFFTEVQALLECDSVTTISEAISTIQEKVDSINAQIEAFRELSKFEPPSEDRQKWFIRAKTSIVRYEAVSKRLKRRIWDIKSNFGQDVPDRPSHVPSLPSDIYELVRSVSNYEAAYKSKASKDHLHSVRMDVFSKMKAVKKHHSLRL